MATARPPERLDNIQGLRAVAAMLVVVLHCYGLGTKSGHDMTFLAGADPWGNAGVDLFFVISGFIMVHINRDRAMSGWRFLGNRLLRIAPLYWFVTGLFALSIARGIMAPVDAGPGQPWTSLLFLSQPLSGADPLLYVGWTLEYEMFFYLCFAASMAIARKTGVDLMVPLFAFVIGAIVLLGVGLVAVEFLFGALLARLLPGAGSARWAGLGLLLGGAALLALSYGDAAAYALRVLYYGVPAAMIVAGAVLLPQRAGALASALGDASYSLYLIHLFALAFMFALLPTDNGWASLAMAIGAAQLYAVGVHRYIERPLNGIARIAGNRMTVLGRATA